MTPELIEPQVLISEDLASLAVDRNQAVLNVPEPWYSVTIRHGHPEWYEAVTKTKLVVTIVAGPPVLAQAPEHEALVEAAQNGELQGAIVRVRTD